MPFFSFRKDQIVYGCALKNRVKFITQILGLSLFFASTRLAMFDVSCYIKLLTFYVSNYQ